MQTAEVIYALSPHSPIGGSYAQHFDDARTHTTLQCYDLHIIFLAKIQGLSQNNHSPEIIGGDRYPIHLAKPTLPTQYQGMPRTHLNTVLGP